MKNISHICRIFLIALSFCKFNLQALSPDDYRRVMKIVEEAILSTDLAMYFDKYKKFADYVENGEFDWQNEDKKECKSLSVSKGIFAIGLCLNFLLLSFSFSANKQRMVADVCHLFFVSLFTVHSSHSMKFG